MSTSGMMKHYPAIASIAFTASIGNSRERLARSCFMWSALEVPVSGSMPMARAKAKIIWAGVAFFCAARAPMVG